MIDPLESPATSVESRTVVKIVVLGRANVGKTCIMKRFCEDTFSDVRRATIGADYMAKNIEIGGQAVLLQIWDTAGQERFHHGTLGSAFYRHADGAVIVYDVTSVSSFTQVGLWRDEVLAHCQPVPSESGGRAPALALPIVVVGNKMDLRTEDARMAEESSAAYAAATAAAAAAAAQVVAAAAAKAGRPAEQSAETDAEGGRDGEEGEEEEEAAAPVAHPYSSAIALGMGSAPLPPPQDDGDASAGGGGDASFEQADGWQEPPPPPSPPHRGQEPPWRYHRRRGRPPHAAAHAAAPAATAQAAPPPPPLFFASSAACAAWCVARGIGHVECSAKDGRGVTAALEAIALEALAQRARRQRERAGGADGGGGGGRRSEPLRLRQTSSLDPPGLFGGAGAEMPCGGGCGGT